ncbi:MAG: rod shape-determining protein MreC [Candidatus Nealsonbacteria bacterium]|nr:rod shape-determining protein MreC [Candidatus Nealsonbacteria bacterium]
MKFTAAKRIAIFIIIGTAVILTLNFFQKEAKGFFYSSSQPFSKMFWQTGGKTADFFGSFLNARNLEKENKELNFKIQDLLFLQNSFQELEKENKHLREAMGIGLQKEFKLELAEIIGKEVNNDVILVDKGLGDGIAKGMPLITSQKVLIGNVVEIYQHYSRVLLISDKKSQLEVAISGRNAAGLLKGSGDFKVFIDLIPKESEIKEGDLVAFRGFLVGIVKGIKRIDVSPFQRAEVSPFFDISNLDKAFVVLNF